MNSLFQSIQKQLGKTASSIAPPTIRAMAFVPIGTPLVGHLSEDDYEFRLPAARSFPCEGVGWGLKKWEIEINQPRIVNYNLLSTPEITAQPLGNVSEAFGLDATRWEMRDKANSQSNWTKLAVAESPELDGRIQEAAAIDLFLPLLVGPDTSANLHEGLRNRGQVKTTDCLRLLLIREVVSKDKLRPLDRPARVEGKQYLEKTPNLEIMEAASGIKFPDASMRAPMEALEVGNRKAFTQERGLVTGGMNVWDLILPLLQRPVTLDFGTTVDLPITLYSFQTKGVEFLMETPSALLGDDMGTGKTVQTSVAMRMLFQTGKIRSALIVCPLSVIPNWDRELAKLAANLAVTVVRGDKKHRKICWRQTAHIWLTTYDTLRNDLEDVQVLRKGGFDLMVLDEAQRVKNWSSGITRAIREIRAKYRWGLTGTPLENNRDELWTILNVLKPDIAAGKLDWSQGIQSVLRPMFLRRRKQDVLTDLPPLVQNAVWLQLEDEQRSSYDQLEKQGVLELHARGETITAQIIIVLINKLKQVCNRCPRTGDSSKLAWLRDSLEEISAEGDKALVFSQFTNARFGGADWLEKELSEYGALNYSQASSDTKRKNLLAAFKEKPEHKVFIGHPKTAGLGLNELVVANYVIHFDHWWNPAVMNQATARAHRPGQKKTVFAYDLWVEGTYEELIFKLLEKKQSLYDEVIDSMSAQQRPEDNLAFAVADSLFAKYGLNPVQRRRVDAG